MSVAEKIAVIGGGIGGLAVALSMKARDCELVIFERDPAPPEIAPEEAFEKWLRPGVPQFRHAHILLSRLQTLLREHHPAVLADLLAAGMELSKLDDVMPSGVVEGLRSQEGDEDLLHLWGRRPTFEYVLWQHVSRMPQVRIRHETRVTGILTEKQSGSVRVCGVEWRAGNTSQTFAADVVVDAAGKRSSAKDWLSEQGVRVSSEGTESGFIYACRHYQVRQSAAVPSRRECGGNLDYLGYSTFFAEHGHYALAFGSPVAERELVQAMTSEPGFEALVSQFPTIKRWRDASEATTKVMGAGKFSNRWTRYGVGAGPELLGFFAVGDCHFETNPMYGRGCASAFVQAHALSEVFGERLDPGGRAREYNERVYALLQPYYEIGVATDRIYHSRANRQRGVKLPFAERLLNYLYEAGWLPATHSSPLVAREFIKAVQMREKSALGLRLAMGIHIASALVMFWLGRRLSQLAPPPAREEFIGRLAGANQTQVEPAENE